jgi:hypothetical protein
VTVTKDLKQPRRPAKTPAKVERMRQLLMTPWQNRQKTPPSPDQPQRPHGVYGDWSHQAA